ncbi:MAG: hypothetical protein OXB93_03385 [Cytophagales bacterium]|nr:hypothetical protein [Cytophagales bacterium]
MFDLALQEYGDIEGVWQILEENGLDSILENMHAGQELEISLEPLSYALVNYLRSYEIGTMGDRPTGIGWMALEKNFVIA